MNIKFNLLAVLVLTFATVALQTSSVAGGLRGIGTPRIDPTVRVDTSMKLESPSFRTEAPISARQADVTQKIINDINPTSPSVTMAKPVSKAPDFIGSSNGTVFPVPKGATGPVPVINPQGKKTGVAFTGGTGGTNGQVKDMRIMDPTPPSGRNPGYPNGYIKYQNSHSPRPQGVDPYTGRTLPESQAHFPIK